MATALEEVKQQTIAREMTLHTQRILLLSSQAFWEQHQEGLDDIRAGRTVELDDLLRGKL